MRNTFVSCIVHMTYEHYIKKPMAIGDIKLNQMLSRNHSLINYLNRNICHPIMRKYSIIPYN